MAEMSVRISKDLIDDGDNVDVLTTTMMMMIRSMVMTIDVKVVDVYHDDDNTNHVNDANVLQLIRLKTTTMMMMMMMMRTTTTMQSY